jgi:hypothetical protein
VQTCTPLAHSCCRLDDSVRIGPVNLSHDAVTDLFAHLSIVIFISQLNPHFLPSPAPLAALRRGCGASALEAVAAAVP